MASTSPVFCQPEGPKAAAAALESPPLTRFDLDFPGGTPRDLVAAIQKALGRPLNVIVPPQFAEAGMPPLTMRSVTVAQLFKALSAASPTTVYLRNHGNQPYRANFAFTTEGRVTDDSIWYFSADVAPPDSPFRLPRFYLLTPFLDRGLTVDDITTAIQTGWKMAGMTGQLSYHKETQLLIVVGEPIQFDTVNGVLQALKEQKPKPTTESEAEKTPEPKKS
jgi:hypothetical protein